MLVFFPHFSYLSSDNLSLLSHCFLWRNIVCHKLSDLTDLGLVMNMKIKEEQNLLKKESWRSVIRTSYTCDLFTDDALFLYLKFKLPELLFHANIEGDILINFKNYCSMLKFFFKIIPLFSSFPRSLSVPLPRLLFSLFSLKP